MKTQFRNYSGALGFLLVIQLIFFNVGSAQTACVYEEAITINNTAGSQMNYPVLITVNTASLMPALEADGGDLRFESSSGMNLDFWVESGLNTAETRVWVKMPTLPAGVSTIYMKHGDYSLSPASNPTSVFAQFFSLGSVTTTATTPYNTASIPTDNLYLEFSFRDDLFNTPSWNQWGGIWGAKPIVIGVRDGTDGNYWYTDELGYQRLWFNDEAHIASGVAGVPAARSAGWHKVKIIITNGKLKIYLDDLESPPISYNPAVYRPSRLTLYTNGHSGDFKDIMYHTYPSSLPATTVGATRPFQPVAQATNLTFPTVGSTSLTLVYDQATGSPDGYLVVRRQGSASTFTPVDGATYMVGTRYGDADVVYVGSALGFTDLGLSSCTNYYYHVFAFNQGRTCIDYKTDAPLSSSQRTSSTAPSAQPTDLSFTAVGSTSMTVGYLAAPSVSGYVVLRKEGGSPAGIPVDDTPYSPGMRVGDGIVAYAGPEITFDETTLLSCTDYHYKVFSFNQNNTCINYFLDMPLSGSQQTMSVEPLSPATALSLTPLSTSGISVSFAAAAGSVSGYLVVRRPGAASNGIPGDNVPYNIRDGLGDGVVAYVGPDVNFTDAGLSSCTNYFYQVYPYNRNGSCIDYLSSSPLSGSAQTFSNEPAAQPRRLSFTAVSDAQITVNYEAATGSPTGYLVLKKTGGYPISTPVDGTPYRIGWREGDATVAYVGSELSFTDTDVSPCTNYFYEVYSYNESGSCIDYLTSSPLSGNQQTSSSSPISQPDNLTFTSIGNTSMRVNFRAASVSPSGYLVIRNEGSPSMSSPLDGTVYNSGTTMADGAVVVYVGTGTSFTDFSLFPCTNYYYQVYSYNQNGTCIDYLTTSPLTGIQRTSSREPVAQPRNLTLTPLAGAGMRVSYLAATGSPDGYIVVRKAGSAPTSAPLDGIFYDAGSSLEDVDAMVVYDGSGLSFTETSLSSCTNYYYQVYSYYKNGDCIDYLSSSPLSASAQTFSNEPAAQPTRLSFTDVSDSRITVNYEGATGSPTGYVVLRKGGGYPASTPVDGTTYRTGLRVGDAMVAYVGSELSFTDTDVFPCTNYFYEVYSYNESGSCIDYLTSSPLLGNQRTSITEPIAQPTALLFTSVSSNGMTVSFVQANGSPTGYLVVRTTGSTSATPPQDGVFYTIGSALGDGTIAYTGSEVRFTDSELFSCTDYYYHVYSYNQNGGCIEYRNDFPLTGSQRTLSIEPSFQAAGLSLVPVSGPGMRVTYRAGGGASGYVVVRKAGGPSTSTPADGVVYVAGDPLGDGTVVYVGSDLTFTETGLSACTDYYYQVYTFMENGPCINYLTTSPLTGSNQTLSDEPTAQPTGLTFTSVTNNSVIVTYDEAEGSPTGYLVVRRAGGTPAAAPSDGNWYKRGDVLGDGTIAYVGPAFNFNDTELLSCTEYYYKIYSYNESGICIDYRLSAPLSGSQKTVAEPGPIPGDIELTIVSSNSIKLDYSVSGPPASGYLIVRTTTPSKPFAPQNGKSFSVGPTPDGSFIVYVGQNQTFVENVLDACMDYYYTVYGFSGEGECTHYTTPVSAFYSTRLNPQIAGFSPGQAVEGEVVTISGSDFSALPSENIVTFNGISADVISSAPDKITCIVPPGASTGLISVETCLAKSFSSEEFIVFSDKILINDLMTPYNGDDINSTFYIKNIQFTAENKVTLIDRYGVIVKEWIDFKNFDDPHYNQEDFDFAKLEPGSYVCILQYKLTPESPLKRQTQMISILKGRE
jgi:hypothetical protein